MDEAAIKGLKSAFRRELLTIRRSLEPALRGELSARIRAALGALVSTRPGARLFAYAPLHGEPDLMALAGELDAGRFFLPVIHALDKRLSFHAWAPGDALVSNRHGIPEPRPDRATAATPGPGDVIAVPAVAVDGHGQRLGYGGGYYDRLLATSPALAVAIVYEPFVLASLPAEAHDRRVPALITEAGLKTF